MSVRELAPPLVLVPAPTRPRTVPVRLLAFVLAGALVGSVWALLRPQQLGGANTYIVTRGTSMEPTIHDGDLVVLQKAEGYEIGDTAAYYSPSIDRVVLHRIVGVRDGRYLLKGDNNSYVDPDRPATGQILGRARLHVAGLGGVMSALGSRAALVFATMIFIGLIALGLRLRTRRAPVAPIPLPALEPLDGRLAA